MTNKDRKWAIDYATITPYDVVNHNLVRTLGGNAAIFLSFLRGRREVQDFNGCPGPEKSFQVTVRQVQEALGLSEDQQRTICTKLVNLGYITLERRKAPTRRTFTINDEMCARCEAGEFLKTKEEEDYDE